MKSSYPIKEVPHFKVGLTIVFSEMLLAESSVEASLRDLKFGYRARFLQQSAKQILDTHGLQWLEGLRSVPYLQALDALRTLPGVGTKVQQPFAF